jgi:hypothetical protein
MAIVPTALLNLNRRNAQFQLCPRDWLVRQTL